MRDARILISRTGEYGVVKGQQEEKPERHGVGVAAGKVIVAHGHFAVCKRTVKVNAYLGAENLAVCRHQQEFIDDVSRAAALVLHLFPAFPEQVFPYVLHDKGVLLPALVQLLQLVNIFGKQVEVVDELLQVGGRRLPVPQDGDGRHDKDCKVGDHLPVKPGKIGIRLAL